VPLTVCACVPAKPANNNKNIPKNRKPLVPIILVIALLSLRLIGMHQLGISIP
jgi:hypothetical protein